MSIGDDFEWVLGASSGSPVGPVYKVGAFVSISREMALDLAYIPRTDSNPFPRFDLFPRLTRAQQLYRKTKHRIGETIEVARHGIPEPEPSDGDDLW